MSQSSAFHCHWPLGRGMRFQKLRMQATRWPLYSSVRPIGIKSLITFFCCVESMQVAAAVGPQRSLNYLETNSSSDETWIKIFSFINEPTSRSYGKAVEQTPVHFRFIHLFSTSSLFLNNLRAEVLFILRPSLFIWMEQSGGVSEGCVAGFKDVADWTNSTPPTPPPAPKMG